MTAPVNATVPATSVLHLGLAPSLNRTAPQGNDTIAMPLAPVYPQQGLRFNTTLLGNGTVTATSTSLWLRITQSNVQAGSGTDPGCSVALTVVVRHNSTDGYYGGGCGSVGIGVVPPGDHLVQFSSPPSAFGTGAPVSPGDDITFAFTFYLSGPGLGTSAYVLAGSHENDSWVRVSGLAEPTQ